MGGGCCCCSVTQLCLTLCNPMECSMPVFPVLDYLPEFAQTHVHCVNEAIQPSHPLLSPSTPACNLSQHQGLFQFFFFLENLGGGSEQKVTVTATQPHEQFLCDSKSSSDGTHPQFYQKAQDLKAEIFWRWVGSCAMWTSLPHG